MTRIFQVDAFTTRPFEGNPAAVCPLEGWPAEATMQKIALENNLSETAFLVPEDGGYRIRWFTPAAEVDLCGHATLASAWVVFHELQPERKEVVFHSRSGPLGVERAGDRIVLDFPALEAEPAVAPRDLLDAVGVEPEEVLATRRDWVLVYDAARTVRELEPRMDALRALERPGVIVTAPGDTSDIVSRFFIPAYGIDEDPVTGAAHCVVVPYWAGRLGRTELHALQVSARGGELFCELRGDRVRLGGHAVGIFGGRLGPAIDLTPI